ncbi:MAG: hypothetical protein FWD48_01100 [Oscillospiraceae bacterium]|nr:hypothetical protein [Oscillospiraceae bacterium]
MGRRSKNYNIEGQLTLFDLDIYNKQHQSPDDFLELLRHENVKLYRTKTIKAGNQLECEIFPLFNPQEKIRAKEHEKSREAQKNLNHKNTKKNITRLSNANFTSSDYWGTFGYDDNNLPATPEEALKDVKNFLRRLARLHKKQGLEFKYIYVTEFKHDGDVVRAHHHIMMSGGISRDEIESKWNGGAYPQTRRLRVKHDCGLNGIANYLAKGKSYERFWGHSKGLKQPKIDIADKKITKRRAEKIAWDENCVPEIFEKLYKDYAFRSVEVKRSDFVSGVYIYVQMYKRKE